MCETETIEYELRLYAQYMKELPALYEKMADLYTRLASIPTSNVSSPRIKSVEEAKYQTSPKVHMEDAAIRLYERKEELLKDLEVIRIEYTMKRVFCTKIQEKLCAASLDPEQCRLLYYRFFMNMSLREIAEKMWRNKDSIRIKLIAVYDSLRQI